MNIVYIVTRADPIGGAQIHVRDLAVAMRRSGHTVAVLTGGSGPFVEDLRAQGIPVTVLRHLAVPIRPFQDMLALRELRDALRRLGPDLVTVHSSKAGILGRLVAKALRVPAVFTVHGWAFTPGIPPLHAALYRELERLVGPLASKIITVSEFDRQLGLQARIASESRLVAVHNGIPDVPQALRADPGKTPVRLVMIARFGAQKDHPTLIGALAGLREHAWELDLVGEGPLLGEVQALAAATGIADRVRFLGQRMDVDAILAGAQCGLLITNWEGFPLSILEAMRAGLPVVASSVGGVGEAVRDGETGFLVPRKDVEILRDRLRRLLTDAALRCRLGAGGRAAYEREFTLDRSVSRTLAVYREIVAAGTGGESSAPALTAATSGGDRGPLGAESHRGEPRTSAEL